MAIDDGSPRPPFDWGPLFEQPPPDPPTGPLAEAFSEEEGIPPAFWKFLDSEEGEAFWSALQYEALDALRRGETRFSPRVFVGMYRGIHKVRINDLFSAWFSDLLVLQHPKLLEIVERRKRRRRGPFKDAGE